MSGLNINGYTTVASSASYDWEQDRKLIAKEILREILERPEGEVKEFTDLVISFIASRVEEMMDDPGKLFIDRLGITDKLQKADSEIDRLEKRLTTLERMLFSGRVPSITTSLEARIGRLETEIQKYQKLGGTGSRSWIGGSGITPDQTKGFDTTSLRSLGDNPENDIIF